jgi:hypothetical protein
MHADGAGTKSSLAYLYWKETGDLSVWRGIAQVPILHESLRRILICAGPPAAERVVRSHCAVVIAARAGRDHYEPR